MVSQQRKTVEVYIRAASTPISTRELGDHYLDAYITARELQDGLGDDEDIVSGEEESEDERIIADEEEDIRGEEHDVVREEGEEEETITVSVPSKRKKHTDKSRDRASIVIPTITPNQIKEAFKRCGSDSFTLRDGVTLEDLYSKGLHQVFHVSSKKPSHDELCRILVVFRKLLEKLGF